ncbi:MAG: hypothetical protein AAGK93_00890, partial [Pseudomonadota bacterium]
NTLAWMSSPEISDWRATCRLDGFNSLISNADMNDPSVAETLMSILGNGETAISNLQRLAADAEAARATA